MTGTEVLTLPNPAARGMAPLVALSLNRRNHALIQEAVAALDLDPGHRVLDVDFASSLSLPLLAGHVRDGRVFAIDPSAEMVAKARRSLWGHVRRGQVVVEQGSAEFVPFPSASFDRVLACQSAYFWNDLRPAIDELFRVLVPGGRLVMAVMPRSVQEQFGFAERGYRVVDHGDLITALEGAGFDRPEQWTGASRPQGTGVVVAHRPPFEMGRAS